MRMRRKKSVDHTPHCSRVNSQEIYMDTIDLVPDSINRHDSEQLPRIFSLALQKKHRYERSQRLWWAQLAAATEYNDDVLTPLKPLNR